jgi:hypothetical protein
MVDNIRVLNLASNDYANMSHNNANALRSIGVDCFDYVLNPHPFGYESQSEIITREEIVSMVNKFDIVQIFHSCPIIHKLVEYGNYKKKLVVYHSGSRYRSEPRRFNELFKDADVVITDQTEFINLCDKPIHYLAPHTDLEVTEKREDGKLIIGHYPSNSEVKGTDEIKTMLEPFKNDFEIRIDTNIIPHSENLKRIGECHIYIELFKPELNGKEYGCFGVTAFEATGLGCLTITNDLNGTIYHNTYGLSPFQICNTKESFTETLEQLKEFSIEQVNELVEHFDTEFRNNHSIQSTGKRILELIG